MSLIFFFSARNAASSFLRNSLNAEICKSSSGFLNVLKNCSGMLKICLYFVMICVGVSWPTFCSKISMSGTSCCIKSLSLLLFISNLGRTKTPNSLLLIRCGHADSFKKNLSAGVSQRGLTEIVASFKNEFEVFVPDQFFARHRWHEYTWEIEGQHLPEKVEFIIPAVTSEVALAVAARDLVNHIPAV